MHHTEKYGPMLISSCNDLWLIHGDPLLFRTLYNSSSSSSSPENVWMQV